MRKAIAYWWQVTSIAFIDATEVVGWGHPARWPVSAILWAGATAFFFFAFHDSEEIRVNMEWLISGLAAAGALFMVVFLFTMLATPPRLAREGSAALGSTIQTLQSENAALALKLSVVEKGREFKLAMTTLAREGQDVVQMLVNAKPGVDQDMTNASGHVDWWFRKAKEFLARETPEQAAWFESDAGLDNGARLIGDPKRANLHAFMERRLFRLREISTTSNA